MRTVINLDYLASETMSPALVDRPDAFLTTNEFRQLSSELEIVSKMKSNEFSSAVFRVGPENKVREIKVTYEPFGAGGFFYGIRDYVKVLSKTHHTGVEYVAVAEASYTSIQIWEDFVPEKFREELYQFER